MFGHEESMLPLCTGLFVACYDFPSVGIVGIDKHFPCAHVDHWLNGEHHAGDEAYVGDAQVGGYDRLEVDAGQRHEVFHILGRYLCGTDSVWSSLYGEFIQQKG